jgi:hypothetical protein
MMKTFEITSNMFTMSGVFYPKGYAFVMFPNAQDAEQVARELNDSLAGSVEAILLDPEVVLRDVGKMDEESASVNLPSVGTEGATVGKYIELARQGHHALMVRVHSNVETEQVMQAVRKVTFSYGQRYHFLAIEDLE